MTYFKVLDSEYRPPIQGGDPIWDGSTLPYDLPLTELDESDEACAAGWNFTDDLAGAFKITGLWKTGRPSLALAVEPIGTYVCRGNKLRSGRLRLLRRATHDEIARAIRRMSEPFGAHAEAMADEQLAWYVALGRPQHDPAAVERGLRTALAARGLNYWTLRAFPSARDTWAVAATWVARAERAARDTWDAYMTRAVADAWVARAERAAWDTFDAWNVWSARTALSLQYAARSGWIEADPALLTTGIRDAYEHGLATAIPVGAGALGWAMDSPSGDDGGPE